MKVETHGIIFSGEMVRAILAGRKTITRRLSKRWLRVKVGDRLWVRETWACRQDLGGVEYRASHQEPAHRPFAHIYDEQTRWKSSMFMPRWASRITLEATEDARGERLRDITEAEAVAEGCNFQRVYGRRMGVSTGDGSGDPPEWMEAPESVPDERLSSATDSFFGLWHQLYNKPGERWTDNPEVVRIAFSVKPEEFEVVEP